MKPKRTEDRVTEISGGVVEISKDVDRVDKRMKMEYVGNFFSWRFYGHGEIVNYDKFIYKVCDVLQSESQSRWCGVEWDDVEG